MEPNRPLKTYNYWFEHTVVLDNSRFLYNVENLKRIIESLGFVRSKFFEETRSPSTFSPDTFFLSSTMSRDKFYIYLASRDKADIILSHLSGVYKISDSPLKNEGLVGNFTLQDLKAIAGDPLPFIVLEMLEYYYGSNRCYFSAYRFMHQKWDNTWWPESWVRTAKNGYEDDELRDWLIASEISLRDIRFHKQRTILEFRYRRDALMFAARFPTVRDRIITPEELVELENQIVSWIPGKFLVP